MSCQKAQGYLESKDVQVQAVTDATRERRGRAEAVALARTVDRVIVAKGKKVVRFDLKKDKPDDDTLAAHLLGPTGNLRAPTMKIGKTLLVGFSPEAYVDLLG